jgi:hypothetical protein
MRSAWSRLSPSSCGKFLIVVIIASANEPCYSSHEPREKFSWKALFVTPPIKVRCMHASIKVRCSFVAHHGRRGSGGGRGDGDNKLLQIDPSSAEVSATSCTAYAPIRPTNRLPSVGGPIPPPGCTWFAPSANSAAREALSGV